jgi:DNA-3-methyladenine glycosylase
MLKSDVIPTAPLRDFSGSPPSVAQRLLGCSLVRRIGNRRLSGIIVEVEAYLGCDDPASHSAKGRKNRNASMFESAGKLYVYTIHARHCLNVVTELAGVGSAVLIRAIEPVEGLQMMSHLRGIALPENSSQSVTWLRSLTSGPGRLCQALAVNLDHDGIDLRHSEEIWIEQPAEVVLTIKWKLANSVRIGISQAADLPLRWFIDGHHLVSGRANVHDQGRTWRFLNTVR